MNATFFQLAHRTFPLPTRSTLLLLLLSTDSEADAPPFVFPFDVGVFVIDQWMYSAPSRPITMAALHSYLAVSFTIFFESNFTAAQLDDPLQKDETSSMVRAAMVGKPSEHGPSRYVAGASSSYDSDYESGRCNKLNEVKSCSDFKKVRPNDTYSLFLMNWLKDSAMEEIYCHRFAIAGGYRTLV